jgi:hypothetical protein
LLRSMGSGFWSLLWRNLSMVIHLYIHNVIVISAICLIGSECCFPWYRNGFCVTRGMRVAKGISVIALQIINFWSPMIK